MTIVANSLQRFIQYSEHLKRKTIPRPLLQRWNLKLELMMCNDLSQLSHDLRQTKKRNWINETFFFHNPGNPDYLKGMTQVATEIHAAEIPTCGNLELPSVSLASALGLWEHASLPRFIYTEKKSHCAKKRIKKSQDKSLCFRIFISSSSSCYFTHNEIVTTTQLSQIKNV